jgi:hypothetical protein
LHIFNDRIQFFRVPGFLFPLLLLRLFLLFFPRLFVRDLFTDRFYNGGFCLLETFKVNFFNELGQGSFPCFLFMIVDFA